MQNIIRKKASQMEIELNDYQIEQFINYYSILIEWNRVMNLTAITEYEEVVNKHFIDSLSLIKTIDKKTFRSGSISVIDIGTGAGFPGIPLKIAFPEIKITLLDSLNKRIKFLNEVVEEIGLKEVQTLHGRAEDYARKHEYREKYDLCVSRAVANLAILSEYALPYVKKSGYFISYKSEKISEEECAAQKAIKMLGGKVASQVEFLLPHSDIYRNLFVIQKIAPTPKKYPRRAGLPSKEPL